MLHDFQRPVYSAPDGSWYYSHPDPINTAQVVLDRYAEDGTRLFHLEPFPMLSSADNITFDETGDAFVAGVTSVGYGGIVRVTSGGIATTLHTWSNLVAFQVADDPDGQLAVLLFDGVDICKLELLNTSTAAITFSKPIICGHGGGELLASPHALTVVVPADLSLAVPMTAEFFDYTNMSSPRVVTYPGSGDEYSIAPDGSVAVVTGNATDPCGATLTFTVSTAPSTSWAAPVGTLINPPAGTACSVQQVATTQGGEVILAINLASGPVLSFQLSWLGPGGVFQTSSTIDTTTLPAGACGGAYNVGGGGEIGAIDDSGTVIVGAAVSYRCPNPPPYGGGIARIVGLRNGVRVFQFDTNGDGDTSNCSGVNLYFKDNNRRQFVSNGQLALPLTVCQSGASVNEFAFTPLAVTRPTWTDPPPPATGPGVSITSTPPKAIIGSTVQLTTSVVDASGSPVLNAAVTLGVTAGPDARHFTAILHTGSSGSATAPFTGQLVGLDTFRAFLDTNSNGVRDWGEPYATTQVMWQPAPVTVIFVQGIGSHSSVVNGQSTCPNSPDFVGRIGWLKSTLKGLLGPGSKFVYYAYRSPYTASPTCPGSSAPQYSNLDSCWSIDDWYTASGQTTQVTGGGEAYRFATFLKAYMNGHPTETVAIVSHSQGGVISAYTVKQYLSATYVARLRAIVTLDSPLSGINSVSPAGLQQYASCVNGDAQLDSAFDMKPASAVITRILDSTRPSTALYTVDADPGYLCTDHPWCYVKAVNDAHSTAWWASAHIQVGAPTHSDIWDGCYSGFATTSPCSNGLYPQSEGQRLVRFTACAVDAIATDCVAYAG